VPKPAHNIASWIAHWAAAAGDRTAVVDPEGHLDYRSLADRARRLSGWLRAHEIRPGDRVALLLENGRVYLESVIALAQVGAIGLPVNWRLSPREIAFLLDDSACTLVIHATEFSELVAASAARSQASPRTLEVGDARDAYEKALAESQPNPDIEDLSGEAPMTLMYTSGTTGQPKGALLPHRKTLYNSINAQHYFGIREDDRVLAMTPLFHSLALNILALPVLYTGASIYFHTDFDAEAVWDSVERDRLTYLGGVPTQYLALIESLEDRRSRGQSPDLDSLRFLFTAGAAIPTEIVHRFEEHGLVLKQGYGQTETSVLTCLDERDASRKAGSVGRPVAHAEIQIVAPDTLDRDPSTWRTCAPGEVGEIVVRGPITMLGYWNRPQDTAETLRGEWLRTTDLAYADEEGFVTLVGRTRDMIISGGENVYPAEVEEVLSQHEDIREVAVVGVPDAKWGEVGRAHVVLEPDRPLDPEALRTWARDRLAGFKIPREFRSETALPRTASGKILKFRLREAEFDES